MIRKAVVTFSTVLAVVIAVLGLVGCWKSLRWSWNGPAPRRADLRRAAAWAERPPLGGEIGFNKGGLFLQYWRRWEGPPQGPGAGSTAEGRTNRPWRWQSSQLPLGLEYRRWSVRGPAAAGTSSGVLEWNGRALVMPCWPAVMLLAACPIVAFARTLPRRRRDRRLKMGLCVRCGYDLTGNTSGVCPECGAQIERGCGI